ATTLAVQQVAAADALARDAAGGVGGDKARQAMARQRARKSPMSQGAGGRSLEKSVARPRVWTLLLLVCVVACASPATPKHDASEASEEPPPRSAPGGPNAEEFGASTGYPKGTPANYWRTRGASAPTAISTRSSAAGSFTRRRRPRASYASLSRL